MYKATLILLILLGLSSLAISQDFPYGKISDEEMEMKKYARDTSAHAVVLQEFGRSRINVAGYRYIKLTYDYHVKIKIFDNNGFGNGTVEIPIYHDNETEDVNDLIGVTYYKDDNGLIQKMDLDAKKVYAVPENKYWTNYKFAMPGLRNGCVIEVKYSITSPFFRNFHPWYFQSEIPKIYSEYEVHIPAFWVYNASIKGFLKLTKNTSDIEPKCFDSHGASCDCSLMVYGISNVPAFTKEPYMTSEKIFLSAINFELVEETHPYTGAKRKMTKEWKDIDYQLKNSYYFGGQLKRKGLFKERIISVIGGKSDELDKAKAIYAYLQKSIKWDNINGIYSENIGKVFDTHTGSAPDINLLLVTALNAAGLNTNVVLLSTRENGAVNDLYPALGDFNYTVAKVDIGDKSYYLDATDPLLSFGMLSLKCINGKGRVFSMDKPSYWVDMNVNQKEKSTRTLDLTLQEDGKLKGTFLYYSIGYEAYKKRGVIKKFNNTDEYIEKLSGQSGRVKILKSEILDLDSLDKPLTEKYEIEFNAFNKLDNRIAFNPFFWDIIQVNPFKLNERLYPVDWGMASDERLIITVHIPSQYTIETPPQSVAVAMPNNGGRFLTEYEQENNMFTFSHVIQLNKSIYSAEEYPYLKEFYNKIIQSEKAEIVFKKK